ncbi:hypothetical protein MASR2M54_22840 [Aliarcobacter cryaerophilus]
MKKYILISLFFVIIFFSACSTKNNISKKEDYKILDEVGIIGIKDTKIQYYKILLLHINAMLQVINI